MKINRAIDNLHALAQKTRLRVFRLLVRAGPEGMAATEIAQRLGVPAATMSFHLGQLGRAGLIVPTREGRSIRYAVDFDAMRRLLDFLMEDCCQGNAQIFEHPLATWGEQDEAPARARRG